MTNTLRWAHSITTGGHRVGPFAHYPSTVIDPQDIAAVAVAVLTASPGRHNGQGYALTGPEALSAADQVAILAEALGRRIEVVDLSAARARDRMVARGMAPAVADALMARGRAGTP